MTIDLCFCRGKTFLFLSYASSNRSKLKNPLHLSRCDWKQIFTCKEKAHQGEHNQFFFPKVDGLPQKSIKRPNDEMRPERYVEAGLKGVSAKKMDAIQGNFEAAVKPDSAKITSRKLTCSTVERWKTQDLVLYEAGSWLTYDSEKTKRGHHCAALKCTERYVVSLNL